MAPFDLMDRQHFTDTNRFRIVREAVKEYQTAYDKGNVLAESPLAWADGMLLMNSLIQLSPEEKAQLTKDLSPDQRAAMGFVGS